MAKLTTSDLFKSLDPAFVKRQGRGFKKEFESQIWDFSNLDISNAQKNRCCKLFRELSPAFRKGHYDYEHMNWLIKIFLDDTKNNDKDEVRTLYRSLFTIPKYGDLFEDVNAPFREDNYYEKLNTEEKYRDRWGRPSRLIEMLGCGMIDRHVKILRRLKAMKRLDKIKR